MYFIFSGEGATDLGQVLYDCQDTNNEKIFDYGPLVYLVDYLIKEKYQYSIIESQALEYVQRKQLKDQIKDKKPYVPRGEIKDSWETGFFFQAARRLAIFAKILSTQRNEEVIAIFFRDTDTRNSSERGEWDRKRNSMLNGFRVENFDKGVAMIPKPVSEAWFLCAIYRKKKGPQYNCDYLEDETFGTAKDHQLKGVLEAELGDVPTISLLNQKIACGDIDFQHLNLPSFNHFKKSLNAAT